MDLNNFNVFFFYLRYPLKSIRSYVYSHKLSLTSILFYFKLKEYLIENTFDKISINIIYIVLLTIEYVQYTHIYIIWYVLNIQLLTI